MYCKSSTLPSIDVELPLVVKPDSLTDSYEPHLEFEINTTLTDQDATNFHDQVNKQQTTSKQTMESTATTTAVNFKPSDNYDVSSTAFKISFSSYGINSHLQSCSKSIATETRSPYQFNDRRNTNYSVPNLGKHHATIERVVPPHLRSHLGVDFEDMLNNDKTIHVSLSPVLPSDIPTSSIRNSNLLNSSATSIPGLFVSSMASSRASSLETSRLHSIPSSPVSISYLKSLFSRLRI